MLIGSRQNAFNDFAIDIGRRVITAAVAEAELFVIQPQQVQDRRVQIAGVDFVLRGHPTKFVRRAIADAPFDAAARIELEGRPMDAQRLKNGRTLIALQKLGKVVEVNAEGDVVWEVNGHRGAIAASRLENGNTLICQQGDNKVVEVDAKGTVVWSQAELRNPYDVQRLPNRNTLIVDYLGVREFNQKGELVWQHASQGVSRVCRHW